MDPADCLFNDLRRVINNHADVRAVTWYEVFGAIELLKQEWLDKMKRIEEEENEEEEDKDPADDWKNQPPKG